MKKDKTVKNRISVRWMLCPAVVLSAGLILSGCGAVRSAVMEKAEVFREVAETADIPAVVLVDEGDGDYRVAVMTSAEEATDQAEEPEEETLPEEEDDPEDAEDESTAEEALKAPREALGELRTQKIPEYAGEPYVSLNGNFPFFDMTEEFEKEETVYYGTDSLGRLTMADAILGPASMPGKNRSDIASIYPAGWQEDSYSFIEGKKLYSRCNLIGWQLSGKESEPLNLFTGTRYMKTKGLVPIETMVADIIRETGGLVRYRVTPVYEGASVLSKGVIMEGWSVEDGGATVCYCIFVYNVQPGVEIDYMTGKSCEAVLEEPEETQTEDTETEETPAEGEETEEIPSEGAETEETPAGQ